MARAVTESALMAALSFLLYLASSIPLLSYFVLLACPLPITLVGLRHGPKRAVMATATTMLLVGLVGGGPTEAYFYLVPFGLLGCITGSLMHHDLPPMTAVALGTLVLMAGMMPAALVLEKAMGLEDAAVQLKQSVDWALDLTAKMEGTQAALAHSETMKKHAAVVLRMPVFFFFFMSLVLFYSNYMASVLVFWRMGIPVKPPPDLRSLRLPGWSIWLVPIFLSLYDSLGGVNSGLAGSIALNSMLCFLAIAYFAGMASTARILDRSGLPPIVRMVISLLMLFVFSFFTTLLGLMSSLFEPPAEGVPTTPGNESATTPEVKAVTMSSGPPGPT